jgi:hypothetical protein
MRLWKPILIISGIAAALFFLRRPGVPGCPVVRSPAPAVASAGPVAGADSAADELPRRLIAGATDEPVEWSGRNPAAKRARKISPDESWMTGEPVLKAGDLIELTLFDDAVFEAEIRNVTRYPNGSVGMTAYLTGERRGPVYLSYSDGTLLASLEPAGEPGFAVISRNGQHYAIEVDRTNSTVLERVPPRVPDAVADSASGDSTAAEGNVIDAPPGSTVVDVMIVYTPAATEWASTNGGIGNVIGQAMQRANEAHTNSDTQVFLNLVHDAEVDYTESTVSTNYDVDLDSLTDGDIENVHAWRNDYAADLVCMLTYSTNYGGYGWLLNTTNGSPDLAFSIVRVQQADWTYTVVHEWGHNMGCHHSKTQHPDTDPGPGLYSYSAGWQWETNTTSLPYGLCTIMTYEDFNNDGTNEYTRIAYFSNPDINYAETSTPVGDATDGDNARTIREMRSVLASYRKAPDLDYDGIPNGWELEYFGGETNAVAGAMASNGVNTVLETYIAGINPTNPASFFTAALTNANGFVIHWNAVSGRVYSVNRTTNLLSSFQPLETNIHWSQNSYTDTLHGTEANGFYRVGVELEK